MMCRRDVLDVARARVETRLKDGSVARHYAQAWRDLLARPTEAIAAALVDPGEHARELRQVSPFAGALDPRTRWRIHREVGQRLAK